MCSITIISSFHKNYGKCNPDQLLKIIERIQPEVIFEELDFDSFNGIYKYNNSPSSNEARAVVSYLGKYHAEHVPVDTYQFDFSKLFNGADQIAQENQEYYRLWRQYASCIKKNGFKYLNSDDCLKTVHKLKALELVTLTKINDEKLSYRYKTEFIINEKREIEMLRNIYRYCEKSPFKNGIFICGIDHRTGLKKKIQEFEVEECVKIEWSFFKTANN